MDFESGNGSSKHSVHLDESGNDQSLKQHEDTVASSSFSSSSASSSSSDSSDRHIVLGQDPHSKDPEPRGHVSLPDLSRTAPSFVGSQTGSSSSQQTQQNQLMDIPGYDPNRIPSSVFAAKPANPMEWSVASNESLFSIHMGNASFSRDHLLALYKSGELPKLDEPINQKMNINLVPPSISSLPTVDESHDAEKKQETSEDLKDTKETDTESEDEKKSREEEEEEEEEEEGGGGGGGVIIQDDHEKTKVLVESKEKEEEQQQEEEKEEEGDGEGDDDNKSRGAKVENPDEVRHSPSISCRSDTSNNSACSFAFPVLAGEDGTNRSSSQKVKGDKEGKQKPGSQTEDHEPGPQSQQQEPPQLSQEAQPQTPQASRGNSWFSCFCRCPLRC